MNNRILSLTFAAIVALCGGAAMASEDTPLPVSDYTVFVDPPTGFVFVKLPAGWRFAGRLDEDEIAKLPGSVVTSLLKSDAESGFSALTFSHVPDTPAAPPARLTAR